MTRPLDPILIALVRALRGIETRSDGVTNVEPILDRAKAA
jgi:hypothetical protein